MNKAKPSVTHDDYKRAESYMPWFVLPKVKNASLEPNWIKGSDHFWYLSQQGDGYSFLRVDATTGTRSPAFDHEAVAETLSQLLGSEFRAEGLPFFSFAYGDEQESIRFTIADKYLEFEFSSNSCREIANQTVRPGETLSPDGKLAAFVRDYNLWLRDLDSDNETPLSTDGIKHHAYGLQPEGNLTSINARIDGVIHPAVVSWSPDSSKLIVHKLDERQVREFHLLQNAPADGSAWPILHSAKVSAPGDETVALVDHFIVDVTTGETNRVDHSRQLAMFGSPLQEDLIWWGPDGDSIYFIEQIRGDTALRLYQADAVSGETRRILSEQGSCMVYPTPSPGSSPLVRVLARSQEIIWYSERDNHGHLYLYDGKSGELENQITSGPWQVREIVHLDETRRQIIFSAGGREQERDPYYRHLYRINLDGSGLVLLSAEDADHEVLLPKSALAVSISAHLAGGSAACGVSPSGKYFVETYSRIDMPPHSVLRNRDGELICKLETADISALESEGWCWPEPFSALADDGETDIYGAIWWPRNFDPDKKYPVIDMVYGGPQALRTPKKSFNTDPADLGYLLGPQAYAELGFICVSIDGRGTPYRSKSFHDFSYQNLQGCAGQIDHIAAIKQLAARHPCFDLERVGVNGHSGGGYTTVRAMLEYPEFYKVGVSSSAAHDYRGYCGAWTERYQGYPINNSYTDQDNRTLAANLQGKLLMAYGDMDDNIHNAMTAQFIEALTKANKDYDLIVLVNKDHTCVGNAYFIRRSWDYFVRHLLVGNPPEGYEVWDGLAALLGK